MNKKATDGVLVLLIFSVLYVQIGLSLLSAQTNIANYGSISHIQPLHVEGRNIKNSLGEIVVLRGVNKHGFEDDPRGHWQRFDGGISYNTFDTNIVAANLDAMRSWGINFVRSYSTVQFWVENTGNHRQIIKEYASLAAQCGIYLLYSFWHILPTAGQTGAPYPPYCENNPYLNSSADFVELWRSIAIELKDYPNILFELWNEPLGDKEIWFNTVQQCIIAIRSTGATNLIVVQWDYGLWANLNYPNVGSKMDWVQQYSLNDTTGNIVYSTHIYRDGGVHYSEPSYVYCWTYDDMLKGLQICLVDYVINTLNKPILVGEIGPNMWRTGDELTKELAFYNNTLTILNEWNISYAAFWWWPLGSYPHLTTAPGYQPNVAGIILRSMLSS